MLTVALKASAHVHCNPLTYICYLFIFDLIKIARLLFQLYTIKTNCLKAGSGHN